MVKIDLEIALHLTTKTRCHGAQNFFEPACLEYFTAAAAVSVALRQRGERPAGAGPVVGEGCPADCI